jgi:hypothetical protein
VVGQVAHLSAVTITGPQTAGFWPITGSNGVSGYASAQYITQGSAPGQPAAAPQGQLASLSEDGTDSGDQPLMIAAGYSRRNVAGATGVVRVKIATKTGGPLGLRGSPDPNTQFVGQAQNGATFDVIGQAVNGYAPIRDDAGHTAWASILSIAPVANAPFAPATKTAAGFAGAADMPPLPMPDAVGPATSFAELQAAALQLKTALATNGCRSYNEPIVKRFQRAAKASGLYDGDADGWYGTVTQAALSQIVGKPAPACFDEPTGGPSNPQSYWSPMGV